MNLKKSAFVFLVALSYTQIFSQSTIKDTSSYVITPPSYKSINDYSYRDFTISLDSSYFEIILKGKRITVVPATFFKYLNFQEFDSIKTEIESINSKQKKIIIKCFVNDINHDNKKLMELLTGGLK